MPPSLMPLSIMSLSVMSLSLMSLSKLGHAYYATYANIHAYLAVQGGPCMVGRAWWAMHGAPNTGKLKMSTLIKPFVVFMLVLRYISILKVNR
jgi:hypothetical protein